MKPKPPHGSKSAFVRAQPTTTPAKKVVALARKEGMTLSIAQVYNIRSTSKLKAKALDRLVRATAAEVDGFAVAVRALAPSAHPPRDPNAPDTQLRRLFAELGLVRSREIVAEVAGRFG